MNDIICKGLSKSYAGKAVLCGLSLTLRGGRISCVMGPSGCGKTTLLRLIAGLEAADEGEITGHGSHLAMVFQEDRLCEEMNAVRNTMLGRRGAAPEEAIALLADFGLEGHTEKPVAELSGGMRRRVAIARALLSDAPLLLLDEPFKGLDEQTRAEVIHQMLPRLAGKTVILVTHDEEEARLLGAEVFHLSPIAE